MTFREAIAKLGETGIENAKNEAALLFFEIEKKDGMWVRENPDVDLDSTELENAIKRRISREPLQHILGKWYFYREEYKVSRDCLIPRADSEMIVDYAIKNLPRGARFLDLCTGSGCLAISTLASRPDCSAVAVDISEAALALARENARHNSVDGRIEFICADILNDLLQDIGSFDAIISNPPYIPTDDLASLSPELSFEPRIALDGGDDGLIFYKRILKDLSPLLKVGGRFIFEIGYDQADALRKLNSSAKVYKDLGKNDRMVIINKLNGD